MTAQLLLVAKAPVPGRAKTRLGAQLGMTAAAELAAAALLDTIDASAAAFPGGCHLALAGALDDAVHGEEIRSALVGWTVFPQQGDGFAQRLAHAHRVVASSGPVVQIGMDTPQVTPDLLRDAGDGLSTHRAVLGPAEDGGWWLLALDDGRRAEALVDVAMSEPTTYADTARALGPEVLAIEMLRDVDTVQDARVVAALAPRTRFAGTWRSVLAEVAS